MRLSDFRLVTVSAEARSHSGGASGQTRSLARSLLAPRCTNLAICEMAPDGAASTCFGRATGTSKFCPRAADQCAGADRAKARVVTRRMPLVEPAVRGAQPGGVLRAVWGHSSSKRA